MNSYRNPSLSMTAGNVDEFEVWVFESSDLVVSVISIQAPWNASSEEYSIDNSSA